MDYTIISIQGNRESLSELHDRFVKPNSSTFKYNAIVNPPDWVEYAPEHPVWLLEDPSDLEKQYIAKLVREVSTLLTLRTWFLEIISGMSQIRRDPWKHQKRPQLDINHTIFDSKVDDILNVVKRQKRVRPHLSLDEIYGPDIGELISFFICQKLYQHTGYYSKTEWMTNHVGTSIEGVLVEASTALNDEHPYVGYCVQTAGGTPWAFFRLLSNMYPELRISVSDVDIERSIIQMKLYRSGKIVGTMTTEDTTIFKQFELHATQIFGGAYFYLPVSRF